MGRRYAIAAWLLFRGAVVVVWLTTTMMGVFSTLLWPIVGLLFTPAAVLAYACAHHFHGSVTGPWLAVFILALSVDFALMGAGPGRDALKIGARHPNKPPEG